MVNTNDTMSRMRTCAASFAAAFSRAADGEAGLLGAPAAAAAFPLSTYGALLSAAPAQLPVPEQVHIIRKKKEKVLDVADFLVGDMLLEGASLTFTLEQKPSGSLRPDKLLAACLDQANAPDDQEQEVPLAFLVDNAWTQSIEPPADDQPLRVLSMMRIDQRAK